MDSNKFMRIISYPVLVMDLGLIALPLPTIRKLQISTGRKVALVCLFSTSLLWVPTSTSAMSKQWASECLLTPHAVPSSLQRIGPR